jgi:predicted aspartyl protease
MPPKSLIAASLMLGASPALAAQTQTTELETVRSYSEIDRTGQTEDVEFRDDGFDRMTVPVRLSGTGPYRFLVDTGADRTAISRELAAKLRLPSGSNASLHSVAGVSTVATATVSNLQLTRRNLKVIDAPLLESANMGADGILGVDSLRSQRVLFDFEAQTMSIVPSETREQIDEAGSIVVRAKRRNGRLVLTHATANGRRLSVVLDTGSQISIGNSALRRELLRTNQLGGSHQVELESVTGHKIIGDYMMVRELEMGGVQLRNLAIVFTDAHTFRRLDLHKKPALLLGMNAMRAFKKFSIDFTQRKIRVVLPEKSELDPISRWSVIPPWRPRPSPSTYGFGRLHSKGRAFGDTHASHGGAIFSFGESDHIHRR